MSDKHTVLAKNAEELSYSLLSYELYLYVI